MKKFIYAALGALALFALAFIFGSGSTEGVAIAGLSLSAVPALCVPFMKDDKFQEKTSEELEAMNEVELANYLVAKSDWNSYQLDLKIEKMGEDSKEVEAFKAKIQGDVRKTMDAVSKLYIQMNRAIDNLKGPELTPTEKNQIHKFIEDNSEEIKKLHEAGSGVIEFTTKADITTGSATNPDGIPELVGTQVAPATNVNLRGVIVDALVSNVSTGLSAYPYTESIPLSGDYDWVAEGGTKPNIDFEIETRYAEPKKVAAHIILTDESVQDIRGLQSIATNYLRAKHDLKRQNGILFGTGVGAQPTGATIYGRTFVPGSMATAVATPNFMDVVNACITDIFTTHNFTDEMPYLPNLVMINPVDFYLELVSAKDGEGRPLYPQAGLFNRVTIGGVTIIPFEDIPAGNIFVADMSKYNTTNYIPYTVRIGWINDQLITNKFTMVGESRLHAFVKNLDEQAFIYDSIATIRTAITAP